MVYWTPDCVSDIMTLNVQINAAKLDPDFMYVNVQAILKYGSLKRKKNFI